MFNTEFFPTPINTAQKMWDKVAPRLKTGSSILDPQAGAGALLQRYLPDKKHSWYGRDHDCYAIEIDLELRMILQGKKITVIGSDFLEYDEPLKFDLVISNPPFSNGAKHFIKGWEVTKHGGQFICLLNMSTITNAKTRERQLVNQIIVDNGGEAIALGKCFLDADRPAGVDVAMVYVRKPERDRTLFDLGNLERDFDMDFTAIETPEFQAAPLAMNTPIKNLVARYKQAEKLITERYKIQRQLDYYLADISSAVADSANYEDEKQMNPKYGYETQIKILKSRFWSTIFNRTKMGTRATTNFRRKFNEFALTQSHMAFTENNIMEVMMMFFSNHDDIMKESLIEVFDRATSYHDKNKVFTEGWKTNKSWKLSRRIILPSAVNYNNLLGFQLCRYQENFLQDLDKIMQWLSGTELAASKSLYTTLRTRLNEADRSDQDYKEPFECGFFTLRFFKKGTLWIDFKDQQLLDKFNRIAAENKKWLPSDS